MGGLIARLRNIPFQKGSVVLAPGIQPDSDHFAADPDIENRILTQRYKNALIHIMIDAIEDFIVHGHAEPSKVLVETRDHAAETSLADWASTVFENTKDAQHFLSSREIQREIDNAQQSASIRLLAREFLKPRGATPSSDHHRRGWYGVRLR